MISGNFKPTSHLKQEYHASKDCSSLVSAPLFVTSRNLASHIVTFWIAEVLGLIDAT